MNGADLETFSTATLAASLRKGECSPLEVVDAYLDRIALYDGALRAYITVCADRARDEARAAARADRARRAALPLFGVPFAVKDQFDTAGVRTTCGSRALVDHVPGGDATAVRRLREAGAILLGKLNLTEFAAGTDDPYPYGEPLNPWDPSRVPGASSGGSAIAVAASLASLTLGEDTGGSARGPAAHCGVVGLRPTWSRVSRAGIIPSSWSSDTAGPMTRTVEDCALALAVVAGADPLDATSSQRAVPSYADALVRPIAGLRAVVVDEWRESVHPEVGASFDAALDVLRVLGVRVDHVSWPRVHEAAPVFAVISQTDAAFVHRNWVRERGALYGTHYRCRMLAGALVPAAALQKAYRLRSRMREEWRALFRTYDVVLSPTASAPAEPIAHVGTVTTRDEAERAFGPRTIQRHLAALAGTPALSVPCGFTAGGLPIGLQIMSAAFGEELIFAVGAAYERATAWHTVRPDLARFRMAAST